MGFDVRVHERLLVLSAAATMMLVGAAVSLVASAADGLFLARVGASHFGAALAVSSALLMLILGKVGAVADRSVGRGRGTLLVHLCVVSAVVLLLLAGLTRAAPAVGGVLALLLGKQLSAAVDLVFWVLAAQRLDARQNRRLVPIFIAAHGFGAVVGAFAVGPLARVVDGHGVLACGGVLFALAAVCVRRFAAGDIPQTLGGRLSNHDVIIRSGRQGAGSRASARSMVQVVRDSGLATHLALLVAAAGVFAPMLYVLMGTAASNTLADEAALTAFFGQYRGAVQIATLVAQVVLAPRLMARAGVAVGFVLAPAAACLSAACLGVSRALVVVVAAQAVMKILDAAVQTPAEKLAQNLLPRDVRGRVAAFLDGMAKRSGAIIGGGAASLLALWPAGMIGVLAMVALTWLVVSVRLRGRFAELAVAELGRACGDEPLFVEPLADERTIERLRRELLTHGRQALAIEVLTRLSESGRVDMPLELSRAAVHAPERARLLAALFICLENEAGEGDTGRHDWLSIVRALRRLVTDLSADTAGAHELLLNVRCLGLAVSMCDRAIIDDIEGESIAERESIADDLRAIIGDRRAPGLSLAAEVACARVLGQTPDEIIEAGLALSGAARDVAFDESGIQLMLAAAPLSSASADALMDHTWRLLRGLRRRARNHPDRSCGQAGLTIARVLRRCERNAIDSAELVLLRTEMQTLARAWSAPDAPPPLALAGIQLIAQMPEVSDARVLAAALGRGDARVRQAAIEGLSTLGADALDVLLAASRYGRRRARVAAGGVLRGIRLSRETLERAIYTEVQALDRVVVHMCALAELDGAELLLRRLSERAHEATHALFVMLDARVGGAGLSMIAARYLAAGPRAYLGQDSPEFVRADRARSLEALDTLLPRELAARIIPVLEDGPLSVRGERAAIRLQASVDTREAVQAELADGDTMTRALIVHALGRSGRANHRDDIFAAAAATAREADPLAMVQRITAGGMTSGTSDDISTERDDMPRLVETVISLSQVSLFSELTTRQLGELADVVRWRTARAGEVLVEQGEPGDAMYFITSGRVRVEVASTDDGDGLSAQDDDDDDRASGHAGESRHLGTLGPGEPFGEMSLFESEPRSATVRAEEKTRVGRISRDDFEALVDDMPSIALAICRVLSRRVRAHNRRAESRTRS